MKEKREALSKSKRGTEKNSRAKVFGELVPRY